MRHPLRTAGMLLLLSAFLSGCAVLPGMKIDPDNAIASDRAAQDVEERFRLVPITADLVSSLELGRSGKASAAGPGAPVPVSEVDNYHYRIQPRDILNVIVWEHPELTIPTGEFRSAEESGRLVREDGTVFYPYAGVLQVAGLTIEQVR